MAEKYQIHGLDCASCALNVEKTLTKSGAFGMVNLNFAAGTLTLEQGKKDDAQSLISSVEPGVVIKSKADSAEETDNPGRASVIRISTMVITAILMTLGIVLNRQLHDTPFSIAEYGLLIPAYLLVGWRVIFSALRNTLKGNFFDENALMTIATVGAIVLHELPEAVGVMLFFYVGEYFQDLAVGRSRKSIKALLDIRPEYANLKVGEETQVVSPEDVHPGDFIVVKPGEKIPLDGVIVEGSSFVDTSALTGESAPRSVLPNDTVLGGMINTSGLLTVRVDREFGESSVVKILELVENAASRKAPTEKFITKFSRIYTPIVVLAAAAVAIFPPLLISGALFSDWIYRALILLVISCPCALVISIPLGYFGGIGSASRNGVLVKGAHFLEALTKVNSVVLDKTGTITEGAFRVSEVEPLNGYSRETVLKYAAYAESASNHPIALSVVEAFAEPIESGILEDYQEIPGFGTKVTYLGKHLLAGNDKLLHRENIPHDNCVSNSTVVYVAVDGILAGTIKVADTLKPDAIQAIRGMDGFGIQRIVMLTGDEEAVAAKIAEETGIDEYYANLLPEEKVEKVEEIMAAGSRGGKLLFVGDGINDAPVISRADVGVAMGGMGSDAAVEAADIVILDDSPSRLNTAFGIARRTKTIIWQNISIALGIKLLFVVLGTMGLATMWEAVFADVGVTLLAIMNSARVLRHRTATS